MALVRNGITRAAMADNGWVTDLAVADLAGTPALYVAGTLDDRVFATYVAGDGNDAADVERTLSGMTLDPEVDNMTDAEWVDEHLAHALTIVGVEGMRMIPYLEGVPPTLEMVVPGIGHVSLMVDGDPLAKRLARMRRHRREDAEGRTITRFGAMSLALVATDPDDLDRIVDTAFAANEVVYRKVHIRLVKDRVSTTVDVKDMRVVTDGIEVDGLPETIRIALLGRELDGQPLSRVVDMPGFGDLRISTINRQTTVNRRTAGGGGTWIKIHVRDEHGAAFEDLEMEDARRVAHETLRIRSATDTEADHDE